MHKLGVLMFFVMAFWKYMLISAPYLLVGFVAAGVIHSFVTVERIQKSLGGRGFWPVLKAAFLGIPLPLCSCAVVPTAVTLKKAGASNASASSFLIATPESGVDSIAMTYALMDLPMTIFRPLVAFISAIFAGMLQIVFNKKDLVVDEEHGHSEGCHDDHSHGGSDDGKCCGKSFDSSLGDRLKHTFKFVYGDLVNDMAFWLLLGLVAGALIDTFIPVELFASLNGITGRFVILAIGIPFYICASASTPIAASLILKGMSPGTALLFLLVGPATNISNILVLQKYIGKRGIAINIFAISVVALVFSFVVDFFYSYFALPHIFRIAHEAHEHTDSWFRVVCAVILGLLLAKGLYQEEIKPRIFKKKKKCCSH